MKSPADMKIIQIEITNACTKRCSNCTRFCGHHRSPFFMDFETFKKAVDSMKGYKGMVGIMGGEPTLHPEFEKFLNYYRETLGYDDDWTTCYEPTTDFIGHILTNVYNDNYHNHRGLWTSVGAKYYQHFEVIQDTFGYQLVNDHTHPSMHQTLMVTRKEVGIPDDEWFKLRDNCWIQNLWSASITPKGAFFCEVAAAMDATLGGPGGWPIEPGWWKRKPCDFGDQLHWCEMCSAALPMPKRDANEEHDDVSPIWNEKLKQIDSPKHRKGLVCEFDPAAYDPGQHRVNTDQATPYIEDQEQRLGSAIRTLRPQHVTHVLRLTSATATEKAEKLISDLLAAGRLDFVLPHTPALKTLAEAAGVKTLDETQSGTVLLSMLRESSRVQDWVLLMTDDRPADTFFHLLTCCVFNPGCLYWRSSMDSGGFQFFNLRALSLRQEGDLLGLAKSYPQKKVRQVTCDDPDAFRMSMLRKIVRRVLKRVNWLQQTLRDGSTRLA